MVCFLCSKEDMLLKCIRCNKKHCNYCLDVNDTCKLCVNECKFQWLKRNMSEVLEYEEFEIMNIIDKEENDKNFNELYNKYLKVLHQIHEFMDVLENY